MNVPNTIDPVESVKEAFSDAFLDVVNFRDETTIVVESGKLPEVLLYLRNTAGLLYNFLSDISVVDYYEPVGNHKRPGRFGVCYHIYSMIHNRRLRVKVYLDGDEPTIATITDIWPAANWLERETYDLMGITFAGHPNLSRIMMPADWVGHPQRRDYPLGEETVQFSFNADEIMKYKPFAKE